MRQRHLGFYAYRALILALCSALLACGSSGGTDDTDNGSESSSSDASSSASSSQSEPSLVLAINVGSFSAATFEEVEYQADQFASGGTINATSDTIEGTSEPALFQTERYGSYTYEVPVTEGQYDIDLHFVEMYWEANGERAFNVFIEDQLVLSELDLHSESGHDRAFSHSVDDIEVTDGHLSIEVETLVDNGTLGGFAIYSGNGEFVPPPEPEPGTPGEPGVASDENTGADCPVSALPDADELPAIATLPDPFIGLDGERITTQEQWRCRRAEINAQLQRYESGPKPIKPAGVTGEVSTEQVTVNVEHEGETITFNASVTTPTEGEGPYPAMIGIGASSLDNDYLASQGIAIINFNNNDIGAQDGGQSRGTGLFFDLYGSDHPASSMTAWAWGVSRLIDVLEASEENIIDPSRLGVTGCSRNGKGALMAGALDERIALTIPQESGAGGAVSWRVAQSLADDGEEVQTLSHAASEQPWFRASFGQTFGGDRVTRLPFDHHQVMGMVAPRGLLVLDNDIDWLGPLPAFVATSAAREIYRALGVPENIAYSENGGHNHCQFPAHQQDVLSAYVQRFLLGEPGNTEVMNSTQGDTDDVNHWVEWTTPTLE